MTQLRYNTGIVKVGTDVVTDRESGHLRLDVIQSIVSQIADVRSQVRHMIIVTSGAVAAGRKEMEGINGQVPIAEEDTTLKQLYAAVGQPILHQAYAAALHERGMRAMQVLLTRSDFDRKDFQGLFERALKCNAIVPVVNENDAVCAEEIRFTDNDQLAGYLADMLRPDFVAFLSNHGLFRQVGEPSTLVTDLDCDSQEWRAWTQNGSSGRGKGSMASKCENAQGIARNGTDVFILDGRKEGALAAAIRGGEHGGTKIARPQL